MKRTYISTFITGFQSVIADNLPRVVNIFSIDLLLDGLIMYQSNEEIKSIKRINFINNSFIVLKFFKDIGSLNTDSIIKNIILDKSIDYNIPELKNNRSSFRIIVSSENQLISVNKKLLNDLEIKITKNTKLRINKLKPDLEFWISIRSEGCAFFGLRFTKNPNQEKYLAKGELRPELASILCLLSEPNSDDIFLDPFCGYGSIPIQRIYISKYKTILSYDINNELINNLKSKIKNIQKSKNIKNFFVHNTDALNMKFLSDNYIDKIVTDPPWGFFEKIDNLDLFYSKMLKEFHRVVKNNGIMVLLVANSGTFDKVLEEYKSLFNVENKYTTLVSGKKTVIYKLKNIK
ncbi:MAG: methyltransferase domain-containing protein [Patescibacteria group bacterium]|nr:methyltransferase domain-containing protein [Patescibacteria group bacterium]